MTRHENLRDGKQMLRKAGTFHMSVEAKTRIAQALQEEADQPDPAGKMRPSRWRRRHRSTSDTWASRKLRFPRLGVYTAAAFGVLIAGTVVVVGVRQVHNAAHPLATHYNYEQVLGFEPMLPNSVPSGFSGVYISVTTNSETAGSSAAAPGAGTSNFGPSYVFTVEYASKNAALIDITEWRPAPARVDQGPWTQVTQNGRKLSESSLSGYRGMTATSFQPLIPTYVPSGYKKSKYQIVQGIQKGVHRYAVQLTYLTSQDKTLNVSEAPGNLTNSLRQSGSPIPTKVAKYTTQHRTFLLIGGGNSAQVPELAWYDAGRNLTLSVTGDGDLTRQQLVQISLSIG